jgi:hypothetical protein
MTKFKFPGTYKQLQDLLLLTGVDGEWQDLDNCKQYKAETGAILNWWESTKTVNFQGAPEAAKQELKDKFVAILTKRPTDLTDEDEIDEDDDVLTLERVERAFEELAEMGLVEDSGRRRNGQVAWVLTPLGKAYAEKKASGLG